MKPDRSLVLDQTGLWPRMSKAVREAKGNPADIELLRKTLESKITPDDLAGKQARLASVLRWHVYQTSTYMSALSYLLYLQRRDYFEKAGPANIHQSLLVSWLGPGLYILDPMMEVVEKLEDLSLRFTVQEVIAAQHEAALEALGNYSLYRYRREVNAAFVLLGAHDIFDAAWKPHTAGVSFIYGALEPMPEIPNARIVGKEYSRSVNLHSGLARTSECSDEELPVYRKYVLAKIYSESGFAITDTWFSEIHEGCVSQLRARGIFLNILDESTKDCFFHARPYLQKHTLNGNANFGQVGLADAMPAEASVYELCRSAAQAFNQIGVAQVAQLKSAKVEHWRDLLYLAVIRCAKDHDFSRGEFHGNLGILVTFMLLRHISEKKRKMKDAEIHKIELSLRTIRRIYFPHRNRVLAILRDLSYDYGGEKLTLSTLVRKIRHELSVPGMTEADANTATWEKIRGVLLRNHNDAYQERIIPRERETLQTLANRLYGVHYNRTYHREKPLEFFWDLYEREGMKRTFPGLWND